jgi:hypothetical protein
LFAAKPCYFLCLELYLFIFCSPKKRTKKGRPQIFFGINIFSAAHALQLVVLRPPQTVMLTKALGFAASKMLIFFQKRSEGIVRLTAIWFLYSASFKPVATSQSRVLGTEADGNPCNKRLLSTYMGYNTLVEKRLGSARILSSFSGVLANRKWCELLTGP